MSTKVLPVIHHKNMALSVANAEMAHEVGCEGVFLIAMGGPEDGPEDELGKVALTIKSLWPSLKVGINYLRVDGLSALTKNLHLGLDMTWTDSPGVHSSGLTPPSHDTASLLAKNPQHQFFGSVAFKYQKPEPNPAEAARLAQGLGMIPTTSGIATGREVDLGKLVDMHRALEGGPLALASGVTPDNAHTFAPYLSHVLVATGISKTFHEFDYELLRRLRGALRS